jgi:hypothetical protein
MPLQLHIANRTLNFRDRAYAPPVVLRRISFRDTDFLTVERLGPMQSLSPEGFLIIRGVPLARTGPQLYSDQEIPIKGDATGRIIIDRLPEDVFRPATLASLQGKAVTLDHPDDDVTPENFKGLLVGAVINPRRGERVLDNLLLGDLIIYDPEAIKAIRNKEVREVSVGYKADYEETGMARGRQRNITCNHLALVRDGRCGAVCRIGDKAFFPRHEENCGCDQCTHDAEGEGDAPVPLDEDLRDLAEGAPENIIQALYLEQQRREAYRLHPGPPIEDEDTEITDTRDRAFKRTGRRIHLHL